MDKNKERKKHGKKKDKKRKEILSVKTHTVGVYFWNGGGFGMR